LVRSVCTEINLKQQKQRSLAQPTFLPPGQRMGEYDMFASPRDPENPDRPYRPSLQGYQWTKKPGRKTSHV